MTAQRAKSRFGAVGKTIGGFLAATTGLVGAWGWFYLLAVSVQGPGGISGTSIPFFAIGLVIWITFWGAALAIVAALFGRNGQVMRVGLMITGGMLSAAILTPIVAAVT